jgi:hypothetical protein
MSMTVRIGQTTYDAYVIAFDWFKPSQDGYFDYIQLLVFTEMVEVLYGTG